MKAREDSFTDSVRQWFKHGLAMFLFLGILLGGGTAAFSLLAASIATLSNLSSNSQTVNVPPVAGQTASGSQYNGQNTVTQWSSGTPASQQTGVTGGTVGANSSTATPGAATLGTTGESAWSGGNQTAGQSVIDQLNNQVDHMHSPLMGVVDSGGVVVGDRVQAAFGHVLAGFVKALFLEQN